MAHISFHSLRPLLPIGLSMVLVGVVALSGCSSAPKTVWKPVAVPTSTVVGTVAIPAPFTARGVPADLAAVIRPLCLGGAFASSPSADKALRRRQPVNPAGSVVAVGAVASWKGVPIAVVTTGKDVTLAVKVHRWRVVGGWRPSLGVPTPSLGSLLRRVLLAGSDARPGESLDGFRADSLHIVGFDGRVGGALGIARDSYVPLASGGSGRINSALTFGGPLGLQRTVTSVTGVPLEGYILTGFDGFEELVGGIGGLPLNVPVAVKDDLSGANVKAGPNVLTPGQALAYGRARHAVAGGDFGRSANQGLLILAAAGFAKQVGPMKLPGILQMGAPKIETSMSAEQVLTFAAGVYATQPNKVHNRVATRGFGWTADRQSIVLLDANARRLFADIRDGNLL